MEVEIKLEVLPEDVAHLEGADFLGKAGKVVRQQSVYFDTPDHTLFQSGYTLRVRKIGKVHTQTIKATGQLSSLFARPEWEYPVESGQPVIDHRTPLALEFEEDLVKLERQFTVNVERRIWKVEQDGSEIEVVLDNGFVIADERQTPVVEMELELKDGNSESLHALARRIGDFVPFHLGVMSKAERDFRLLEAQRFVFKAEDIELDRSMRTSQTLQSIVASCFRHFRMNEATLRSRGNAEALHQARVALRRMRSAYTLYKSILQDDESKRLSEELKWLAGVLGKARDIDVLLAREPEASLLQKINDARANRYSEAFDAVQGSRGRLLMLDLHEWMHSGAFAAVMPAEEPGPSSVEFASGILEKMRKKLKKDGRALAKVSDEERHEVRKDAKKLRYAAEFFKSFFSEKRGARRHKRFIAAMEELQDHLGALNDLVTGPNVLAELGIDEEAAKGILPQEKKGDLIRTAQNALDDVIDAKRFWR